MKYYQELWSADLCGLAPQVLVLSIFIVARELDCGADPSP